RGGLEIARFQPAPVEQDRDLNLEIGIGLGSGPDDEKEMLGLDRRHAPGRDPALYDRAFGLEPGLEVAAQPPADPWRPMQDLIGEDLGGLGPAPGEIELGGDIV